MRMELGEPDASGRRRPVPIEGSEFTLEVDAVVPAIGQSIDLSLLPKDREFGVSRRGMIEVDPVTHATGVPGIFAGGDMVTGPATVVEAVASGREAAISIDKYLRGEDMAANRPGRPTGRNWSQVPDGLRSEPAARPAELDPAKRTGSFDEVEQAFTEEQARAEAARCIDCGVCSECLACVTKCEARAIMHDQKDELKEIDVGSIIIATGFDALDPSGMDEYGYGRYPNVLTNLEFERLSNATGPTSGKIFMRDPENRYKFTTPPESVAILHCIGSRDENYHEYCSRTCCMYALKYAHLIKDKVGHEAQVYNFYIDMRCFGKGYEEFMKRVQGEGVRLIRGKAARVTDIAESPEEEGKLTVVAEDTLTATLLRVPLEVARRFGIATGADGFFLEEHPKLEPVSTATSGVFLAGACQGPKDIPDTVAQAKGAACEALALSTAGKVTVSPMISHIDPDVCVGCKVCIGLCAYSAIEFDERHHISVVNEAVCKGCGSCAGYCPSGAAKIRQFTDSQIFREIDGILF
jgi:heterodisulfide reductase subunit A